VGSSLRDLRDDAGFDQTLQNPMRTTTLNLELHARYRVFEYEARQDGHEDTAELFRDLRRAEGEQIAWLLAGLRARLLDSSSPGGKADEQTPSSREVSSRDG
jgi:rubrerythrin